LNQEIDIRITPCTLRGMPADLRLIEGQTIPKDSKQRARVAIRVLTKSAMRNKRTARETWLCDRDFLSRLNLVGRQSATGKYTYHRIRSPRVTPRSDESILASNSINGVPFKSHTQRLHLRFAIRRFADNDSIARILRSVTKTLKVSATDYSVNRKSASYIRRKFLRNDPPHLHDTGGKRTLYREARGKTRGGRRLMAGDIDKRIRRITRKRVSSSTSRGNKDYISCNAP